jgi:hypothetical protein
MLTSAVILACLIEIINVPVVVPLPVGLAYGDGGFSNEYRVGEVQQRIINAQNAETNGHQRSLHMVEPGLVTTRSGGHSWIRFILTVSSVLCYVASVRRVSIRDKVILMCLGAVLSYGSFLF